MECCVLYMSPTCPEANAHAPHTLLTCLSLVAVMVVFCCVVLRDVALAEAVRTSSRKKVVPLPTAVICFISLSLLHVDPNSVSGREVAVFYGTAVTTPQTSCVGGRKAVSHSLEWPFTLKCSQAVCVASVCALLCIALIYVCLGMHRICNHLIG